MKLEPLFKSEGNALFLIDGTAPIRTMPVKSIPFEKVAATFGREGGPDGNDVPPQVCAVVLPRAAVEISFGAYNEEALSALRTALKKAEENGICVFFVPNACGSLDSPDDMDALISAMAHVARRIKDCGNVAGFAVPPEFLEKDAGCGLCADSWSRRFSDALSVKHGHYLFFADAEIVRQNALDAEIAETDFVLYKM